MGWINSNARGYLGCILLVLGVFISAHGQTYSEWMRQKRTQKKYLIQQIAALKVYAGQLKKGYKVAKEGLGLVKGFTNGEFDLHRLYLNSLKVVSPIISKDPKVAAMITAVVNIRLQFDAMEKLPLNDEHLSYLRCTKDKVLGSALENLEELERLLSHGTLEMTDDQRIQRLSELHQEMQDKNAFSRELGIQARQLAVHRQHQSNTIKIMGRYHGNK
ncbi:hypothetical protein ACQKCH_03870 [Nubsella zeaxanthinifaciens]|uniref:hypothetical protein n=1 Tax=Nubsella zeaxanthinifaciens TaxID=392412 RepID=UPI003D043C1F